MCECVSEWGGGGGGGGGWCVVWKVDEVGNLGLPTSRSFEGVGRGSTKEVVACAQFKSFLHLSKGCPNSPY